jgi:hypothetical protein
LGPVLSWPVDEMLMDDLWLPKPVLTPPGCGTW